MKIAFVLPGFHRVDRGAEVALLSVAAELARAGDEVTVIGSGEQRAGVPYRFRHVPAIRRERFERFPFFPPMRSDVMWEDATFAAALLASYRPSDFDAVVTCSFPFTHMALGRPALGKRPLRIFVTQNGDWPAQGRNAEYRLFECDGLVCTNPDYFETNKHRWNCALIPNGVDLARFGSGSGARSRFGLPQDRKLVLMVSAFIESKRVLDGIRAVAQMPDAHLVVAGDGHLRQEGDALAEQLMPGRYSRISLTAAEMPDLYRSADVFLHMSLLESFGNVFLEAMASGLPIVGHDTPRLRWIVGDDQPLCDTEDQAALLAALSTAAARGRGAPDPRAQQFGWAAIAAQYRVFIERLYQGSLT